MEKEWYVIHTYSGYENKVKTNLERRVESMNMEEEIFRVVVPVENEIQVKGGKKKITPRKVYPGYVLVEMYMTDQSWYVVRNTPGVTGFVGTGSKPVPLFPNEAEKLLADMGYSENKIKVDFTVGESVRMTGGWASSTRSTPKRAKCAFSFPCLAAKPLWKSNFPRWKNFRP